MLFQVFQKYHKVEMSVNMKSNLVSRGKNRDFFVLKVRVKSKVIFFNSQEIKPPNAASKLPPPPPPQF